MEILLAGNSNSTEWDDYIDGHAESCVFQTFAWRRVVENTYGHRPFYLMARVGSRVCGVLPLFLIKGNLWGSVIASCPYTSSGAVCADNDEIGKALVEKAIELALEHGVRYLELKSRKPTNFETLKHHTDYVNYFLPIQEPEIMWRHSLKKKTRESVKTSQRKGLTLSMGHELLDTFYEVTLVNMRRLGTPVHSKMFFSNILSSFGPCANILAVTHEDKLISFALLLHHRKDLATLFRSSLSEFFKLRPNNFLYWEIFKYAYSSGTTLFDFGRSLAGTGSADFKEAWGAQARPLYYEYFLNRTKTFPRINQNNPHYRVPRLVWQHMPLKLTKLLGPHLIKNIP